MATTMPTSPFSNQTHNLAYYSGYPYNANNPARSRTSLLTNVTPPQPQSNIVSPTTSSALSPISPISVGNTRQLTSSRPTAPRPTTTNDLNTLLLQRPSSPHRSSQNSLESRSSTIDTSRLTMPATPVDDVFHSASSLFVPPLSQITRVVSDEWWLEPEEHQVTGAPTRGHWKPDDSVSCCTSPTCPTVFTLMSRRHHCRRCGGIYCQAHSAKTVPLDQEARFHPQGGQARACNDCYRDFQIWESSRKSRASSIASGIATPPLQIFDGAAVMAIPHPVYSGLNVSGSNEMKTTDIPGIKTARPTQTHQFVTLGQESVKDHDWNWSTF